MWNIATRRAVPSIRSMTSSSSRRQQVNVLTIDRRDEAAIDPRADIVREHVGLVLDGLDRGDVVLEPIGLGEQAGQESCRFLQSLRKFVEQDEEAFVSWNEAHWVSSEVAEGHAASSASPWRGLRDSIVTNIASPGSGAQRAPGAPRIAERISDRAERGVARGDRELQLSPVREARLVSPVSAAAGGRAWRHRPSSPGQSITDQSSGYAARNAWRPRKEIQPASGAGHCRGPRRPDSSYTCQCTPSESTNFLVRATPRLRTGSARPLCTGRAGRDNFLAGRQCNRRRNRNARCFGVIVTQSRQRYVIDDVAGAALTHRTVPCGRDVARRGRVRLTRRGSAWRVQ